MYMNNAADLWDLSRNAYKITKYAIISILVVSWIGCTTAIVSMFSYYYHPECTHMNWVIQAKLDHDKTHFDVVITILFRAVSALLTVKHGKFPNVTSEDKLCASLSFLAGFFMFAFLFVLNLQMIMDNSLAEMSNFKFFNQLQHYMSSIRLPPMLKKKIKDFYDYRFRNNSLYDNDTKRMLSESLEYEIKMFRYRSVLLKANITSDLPTEVIQNMLSKVEVEHFMTGDCIIKSGRIGTCMYFIVTGTVAIYTYFGVEMCHLYDGAHFGEMALLLEQRRVTTAIALEPCELCRLNKSDFYECLSRESGVFQKLVLGAKEGMKTVKVLNEMHRAELEKLHILQTKGTLKKYLEGRHQQF
ncbi:potassium/sodium hyperpolarization-activated cyclic nucleotide-gated channel 4-like isoform X2 [Onthophagus taurus]